jgi:PAS domain S-box-containing protein
MQSVPPRASQNWVGHRSARKQLAYGFAVVFPVVSALLTARSHVLDSIPFALYYISIAAIGILGGLGPALLAAVLCFLSRNLIVLPAHELFLFDRADWIRVPTLFAQALLVSLLNGRRLRSAEQLESALGLLQERSGVLEERSEALAASLRASKCASWILDIGSGKSTQWYSGSYPIFGRPFEELEALPSLVPLVHVEDQPRLVELRERMRTMWEPIVFPFRVIWPDGEVHSLEMRGTRIPGEECVWRGVTVDITELKLAETALLRQEKLAAMGRLASTVAHEINNPLEAVTNILYLVRTDESLGDEARDYLAAAEQELARLGDITRLTLGFVRTTSTRRPLALEPVVEDVLSIFRHRYERKAIAIERKIEPEVSVLIAPHELRQILTNLVSNAADALNVTQPRISIRISAEERMGEQRAVFVLEDNGTGISEAAMPRIFEPFFTTKSDVGTGIGLWVTRELVEANGGCIQVESGELGGGMRTRFRLEFPLAGAAADVNAMAM